MTRIEFLFIGSYQHTFHGNTESLEQDASRIFFALSDAQTPSQDPIPLPREKRMHLMYKIIDYYHYHMDGFKEVKSLKVLEAVFRGGNPIVLFKIIKNKKIIITSLG